jgi:hypothetical protein
MSKYRLLTLEELYELEKEFIDFLILNNIAADEWEQLKKEDPETTDRILNLFSDVVFESIMRKVEYLEYREQKEIKTFQCLAHKLVLVGLEANEQSEVDFNDPSYIQKAIQNSPASLKIYTSEKPYSKSRELELFEMIRAGCTISDGKLFKALCLALPH